MSNSRLIAWAVWIVASVFYAYQYILRVMPNILMDNIMLQFNIDAAIFGQFSGVYYLGYSLIHLPIGIMLDHYGPRKVMTACIILTVIGLLPIIYTDNYIYPIIGRVLIGIGSSAAILGVFKIIRMTFSKERFSRMLSFSVTIGLIGGIYGGAPVAYMNETLGYNAVVEVFILIGIVLAIVTYFIVPEMEKENKASIISEVKEVLGNKKVILTCIFAGLMVGPMEGFADVWGTTFFKKVYQFDGKISASLPSMILIGMCFGAPILNFIAERSKSYLGTVIGSGIVMTLVFIALLLTKVSVSMITVGFIIVGICCAYQILAIYKASTYVKDHVVGLTTAVANMIIMFFGYGFHSVIGYVIQLNTANDSALAFTYGIGVIPITLVMGTIGFMMISFSERKKNIKS